MRLDNHPTETKRETEREREHCNINHQLCWRAQQAHCPIILPSFPVDPSPSPARSFLQVVYSKHLSCKKDQVWSYITVCFWRKTKKAFILHLQGSQTSATHLLCVVKQLEAKPSVRQLCLFGFLFVTYR